MTTRTVTVMSQFNGILYSVDSKEGQHVRKGQVIARIDSRALEAQLATAQGTLIHDQAALLTRCYAFYRLPQLPSNLF
jgi:multidrug efflux system membrane fusion protein